MHSTFSLLACNVAADKPRCAAKAALSGRKMPFPRGIRENIDSLLKAVWAAQLRPSADTRFSAEQRSTHFHQSPIMDGTMPSSRNATRPPRLFLAARPLCADIVNKTHQLGNSAARCFFSHSSRTVTDHSACQRNDGSSWQLVVDPSSCKIGLRAAGN